MHLLYALYCYALMPFLISPMLALALFVVLIETVSSLQSVGIFVSTLTFEIIFCTVSIEGPSCSFALNSHCQVQLSLSCQLLSSIDIS